MALRPVCCAAIGVAASVNLLLCELWEVFYPYAIGIGNFFMHSGERIREERERLGFNQADFAALADSTRKTLFNWESGTASPNAAVLAAWAEVGLDVLYVVTGERSGAQPAHDAAEQVLLDSYRRCNAQARQHLIQTAALLAAGMPPAPAPAPRASAKGGGGQSVVGDNAIQIGSVSGKARVKNR